MKKYVCDVCKNDECGIDYFNLRGNVGNGYQMDYWEGDICLDCQKKMREAVKI